ncbi:TPA: hypothetical protein N0F65_012143, partial [Lagenidium giganteum]
NGEREEKTKEAKLYCGVYDPGSVFSIEIKYNAKVEELQKNITSSTDLHIVPQRFHLVGAQPDKLILICESRGTTFIDGVVLHVMCWEKQNHAANSTISQKPSIELILDLRVEKKMRMMKTHRTYCFPTVLSAILIRTASCLLRTMFNKRFTSVCLLALVLCFVAIFLKGMCCCEVQRLKFGNWSIAWMKTMMMPLE